MTCVPAGKIHPETTFELSAILLKMAAESFAWAMAFWEVRTPTYSFEPEGKRLRKKKSIVIEIGTGEIGFNKKMAILKITHKF